MSEHCGQITYHTRRRGKDRFCNWCGQKIAIGEQYAKWLYFDGGMRGSVRAHAECADAWMRAASDEGYIVYGDGSCNRPSIESPANA